MRVLFLILILSAPAFGQKAKISEQLQEILTYPYSDPNPIPILEERNSRIYPYFSFDGYSTKGYKKMWKVVTLENDFVKVFILPEIGGKIWGAIDKSTGHDFVYLNEVIKFRNVALRGPWVSGGIEYNFGTVGHAPSTSSPVDYLLRENEDGSVSCFLSNMDLPSRTVWSVEVRLPADKAFFETRSTWQNPTPIPQSYYQWMNAAARVSESLRFHYSGNATLEHNGLSGLWPIGEDGIDRSKYSNNNFGTHRSWHIAGSLKSFMGGYYEDTGKGFGHWSRYEQMPGKKLWLWALSRNGGIWEDLLTDNNGQYMEFQSGRYLNQFLGQASYKSPITHAEFQPGQTDRWTDVWFPFNSTGGMVDASRYGVLNVAADNNRLTIRIHPLTEAQGTVIVKTGDSEVYRKTENFKTTIHFQTEISGNFTNDFSVTIDGLDLSYSTSPQYDLKRSFDSPEPLHKESAYALYMQGEDHKRNRNYRSARHYYHLSLRQDRHLIPALLGLAEVHYRFNQHDSSLHYTNLALRLDTYHPAANYLAGLNFTVLRDLTNALESYGWAARSNEFRSSAYAQMALIFLRQMNPEMADDYARKSIEGNQQNPTALKVMAVLLRKSRQTSEHKKITDQALGINPLNHFFRFENTLTQGTPEATSVFKKGINNEFPFQTYLEVALDYYAMGQISDALLVLDQSPDHPLVVLWKSYLTQDKEMLQAIIKTPIDFVLPYRSETEQALQWASASNNHWVFQYYLALLNWSFQREANAVSHFNACGDKPDQTTFYLTRATYFRNRDTSAALRDLTHALRMDDTNYRTWKLLIQHQELNGTVREVLELTTKAHSKFKGNSEIGLMHARALMNNKQYAACLAVLQRITILPFEGSYQGKAVYEQANLLNALQLLREKRIKQTKTAISQARKWPENLGVGKPYEPDTRLHDYLELLCTTDKQTKQQLENQIVTFTREQYNTPAFQNLLGIQLLKKSKPLEFQELMQKMEASSTDNIQKWVVLRANGKDDEAATLESQFQHDNYFKLTSELIKMREVQE